MQSWLSFGLLPAADLAKRLSPPKRRTSDDSQTCQCKHGNGSGSLCPKTLDGATLKYLKLECEKYQVSRFHSASFGHWGLSRCHSASFGHWGLSRFHSAIRDYRGYIQSHSAIGDYRGFIQRHSAIWDYRGFIQNHSAIGV